MREVRGDGDGTETRGGCREGMGGVMFRKNRKRDLSSLLFRLFLLFLDLWEDLKEERAI
jgi:hypothetical protein